MRILDLRDAPEQVDTLARWHHAEWAALYPDETLADFRAQLSESLGRGPVPSTFVACEEGLLGSASLVAADMNTHPELGPWLASVFVAPAARGRGVGTALIRRVMQEASAAGIAALYLFSPHHAGLYRALGWEVLAQERYQGASVTLMRWQCAVAR